MATRMTKAWTYRHEGYPAGVNQTSIPISVAPGPTEIHVRTKAAAINPVDIQLMNLPVWSYLPHYTVDQYGPMWTYMSRFWAPGHKGHKGIGEDFSGVVVAAGEESGYQVGDQVFGLSFSILTGTVQETAVVDIKSSVVMKKPADWSWEQAAALPLVWLTARSTIAAVEPYVQGKGKVAILGGSSATGMYAVYLAAQRGWHVLSTCSGRNVEFVKSMGAQDVVDYTSTPVPTAVKEYGPDAIIDCVGGTECLGLAKKYVTIVGDKTSRSAMGGAATYLWNPRMVARMLAGRIGLSYSYDCMNLEMKNEYLKEAVEIPQDKIVIDSTWKFDQLREALDRLNTGRARGKIVVTVDGTFET